MTSVYEKAPCVVCGRLMRVKKDGTVGHHGGPVGQGWMGGRSYRCVGTDLPPVVAPVGSEQGGNE